MLLIPPARQSDAWSAVILEGWGHFLQETSPEAFNLISFLLAEASVTRNLLLRTYLSICICRLLISVIGEDTC